MPSVCCICGQSKHNNPEISLHCFPKNPDVKKKWIILYWFPSYEILVSFYTFLGPAVNNLVHYWGARRSRCRQRHRQRRTKLDPFNQFFMTLTKLKLNLNIQDTAFRFQISTTTVSRYFITWIAFLYHELKEIAWFPTKEQVAGTLPCAFRAKYPSTVAIIDATEVFIETPSDLESTIDAGVVQQCVCASSQLHSAEKAE